MIHIQIQNVVSITLLGGMYLVDKTLLLLLAITIMLYLYHSHIQPQRV